MAAHFTRNTGERNTDITVIASGAGGHRGARVLDFAIHYKIPTNHLALAWALRRPTVKSVLIGTTEPSHLRHNVDFSQAMIFMEGFEKVLTEMGQPEAQN
jgi:aryl-alcohol dehydrogenase-like predicted oxidoreductase